MTAIDDLDLAERSWARCLEGLGAHDPAHAVRDRLLGAWGEPHRHYHTDRHLLECLQLFERHAADAERPAEVEAALWFHDAVYDPSARDNEARSAAWAVDALAGAGAGATAAARVASHILATGHAAVPDGGDEALVVDIDLAILGAPPARFDEYEAQIRAEYAHVPGAVFRRRRRQLLEGFLRRPAIYRTPALREALEARARTNLSRSIARLGGESGADAGP